jgi:YHS domain-containing protein
MAVTNKSFHHSEHKGRRLYFCGTKCKGKFDARAEFYSEGASPAQATSQRHLKMGPIWLLGLAVLLALGFGASRLV